MKHAIFVVAVLLGALLADCDLNPQPFPPQSSAPGHANFGPGSGGGSGSSGGSTDTTSGPAEAGAASGATAGDASVGFYLDAPSTPTVEPSGDPGPEAGERDAPNDSAHSDDAPNEPEGASDSPRTGIDPDAAVDVVTRAGD